MFRLFHNCGALQKKAWPPPVAFLILGTNKKNLHLFLIKTGVVDTKRPELCSGTMGQDHSVDYKALVVSYRQCETAL